MSQDSEKDGGEKKISKFFEKVKAVKHIEVIVAIICCVALVLVYFSFTSAGKVKTTVSDVNNADLSKQIAEILGSIKGAGKVNILITYDGGKRIEIAHKTETNSTVDKDGTTTTVNENKTPVIITQNGQSQPIILSEISPKIEGVLVVAQGGADINVKLQLIDAVRTLLEVPADKIRVFEMK